MLDAKTAASLSDDQLLEVIGGNFISAAGELAKLEPQRRLLSSLRGEAEKVRTEVAL